MHQSKQHQSKQHQPKQHQPKQQRSKQQQSYANCILSSIITVNWKMVAKTSQMH